MNIIRNEVPIHRRVDHAADIFGKHFPLILEPTIYSFASRLSDGYQGGYWNFYALNNGGFFMVPDAISFKVAAENGYKGTMTADAFGITSCLYAYSHLSFGDIDDLADECARQFQLLREFMLDHPEAGAILGAID